MNLSSLFIIIFIFFASCQKSKDVVDEKDKVQYFLRIENTTSDNYRAILYNNNYSVRWEKNFTGNYFQPPIYYKGLLYFSAGYSISAVDVSSGTNKWQINNTFGFFANPSVKNDTLVYNHVSPTSSTIEGANALTGQQLWSVPFPDCCDYGHGSILDNNIFYFISGGASPASSFTAFDISKKQIIWRKSIRYPRVLPLLNDEKFYTNSGNVLSSFNTNNATVNWERQRISLHSIGTYKDLLICDLGTDISTDPGITAFNSETGNIQWERYKNITPTAKAIIGENMIVSGYEDFNKPVIFCTDIPTGNIIWKRSVKGKSRDGAAVSGLCVLNNTVYANFNEYDFSTIPYMSSTTVSFDLSSGTLIDSAKIGANLMIITNSGKLFY